MDLSKISTDDLEKELFKREYERRLRIKNHIID